MELLQRHPAEVQKLLELVQRSTSILRGKHARVMLIQLQRLSQHSGFEQILDSDHYILVLFLRILRAIQRLLDIFEHRL